MIRYLFVLLLFVGCTPGPKYLWEINIESPGGIVKTFQIESCRRPRQRINGSILADQYLIQKVPNSWYFSVKKLNTVLEKQ